MAWTSRAAVSALVLTLLAMAALIGVKVATNARWRGATESTARACERQNPVPANGNPVLDTGHLADCLARRNPVRHDPVDLITLAGLATLAAVEIGYLTRHR